MKSPSVTIWQLKILYMLHMLFDSHLNIAVYTFSILRGMGLKGVSDSWSNLYWYWCHLTGHTRFPINLPLSLSCTIFKLYQLFTKKYEVTWYWAHPIGPIHGSPHCIMHTLVLTTINKIKFDVFSFFLSEDNDEDPNFKMGHVTLTSDHVNLGVFCHPKDDRHSLCIKFENSSCGHSRDIT